MPLNPSAKISAKMVYDAVPSLASANMAIATEFNTVKDLVDDNPLFNAFLMELTAEALIAGISDVRGRRFGDKLRAEYGLLSPEMFLLSTVCISAAEQELPEDAFIAFSLLRDTEHGTDYDTLAPLVRFISLYRESAYELSENAIAALRIEREKAGEDNVVGRSGCVIVACALLAAVWAMPWLFSKFI